MCFYFEALRKVRRVAEKSEDKHAVRAALTGNLPRFLRKGWSLGPGVWSAAGKYIWRLAPAHAGQSQVRLLTEFCGKEISVIRPPRCN